ncbi:hypothetical protein Ade02nite_25130 [Paractinoplanes deccanensis]|uniref:Uncharacterized protein n=1 Tax=Paractinoplanes deccanensis TaxID=113561 RepID=A0ABQ3Y1K6_9ACTN|nr:hypothetical protein [Actinoplanes deccanensis]GID73872.1 hypothetical protein Ade02nite_25130 [Actinoplanes deccanensis]
MPASIGIWAQGDPHGDLVLYRWEADRQTGFVTFEVLSETFRPADENGRPVEDGGPLFAQVVAAIRRAYRRGEGKAPATAHVYYF